MNLNCWEASMKPYISKKNKMGRLKFATEHVIWTEEKWDCVPFNDESKFNLFSCDGRRFFDALLRNDIHLSTQKAALNLEEEVWWCLAWLRLLVQHLLSSYTVKLTQLFTKRYWRNMLDLIWELQPINQLYLCKITLRVKQWSLFRHFYLWRTLLLMEWPV